MVIAMGGVERSFRFLLGQSELSLDGNLYIRGKQVEKILKKLQERLNSAFNNL